MSMRSLTPGQRLEGFMSCVPEPSDETKFTFTLPPSWADHCGSRGYKTNCREVTQMSAGGQSPHQCSCATGTLSECCLVTGSAGCKGKPHVISLNAHKNPGDRNVRRTQPLAQGARSRELSSEPMACSTGCNADAREKRKGNTKAQQLQRGKNGNWVW